MSEITLGQVLNDIVHAIDDRKASKTGKWCIILQNGKIICKPVSRFNDSRDAFCQLNENKIRFGMTVKEWQDVALKIFAYLKEQKKCHQK